MRKGFTRHPKPDDVPKVKLKNYITPAGLQRLREEHHFLLTKERPAVTKVVQWAASNGDRSENADYQYAKRRLRQGYRFVGHACHLGGTLPPLQSTLAHSALRGWNAYSSESTSASQEASMMFSETPIVPHSRSPSEESSRTRVTAPVPWLSSRIRTL